jgi:hypothetical protein
MVAALAPADDEAPRCIEVPEMKTQPRSLSLPLAHLLARLSNLLTPAAATPQLLRRSRSEADVEGEPEPEPPGACGWFDSSHELVHGLQVQELTSPESQAAALPLATWLQLQLDGCSSVQPA